MIAFGPSAALGFVFYAALLVYTHRAEWMNAELWRRRRNFVGATVGSVWGLLVAEIVLHDFGIDLWAAVDPLFGPGEPRMIWQLRLAFGSLSALLMLMAHVSMLKLASLL